MIVMLMPEESIHDTCSFLLLLFLEGRFFALEKGLGLEVIGINVSELLKELAAKTEYKLFLHFFPIGLNENTSICLEVHYLYVTY
jgi:hypothetical protein